MVEQPENNIIHFDMTKLSSEDAVTLVEQCEKIPVRYLWEKLSSYIRQLKIAANYNSIDTLDSFIHIVNKGFRYKSEEANALRYFYWGYFSHMQEQLLQMFDEEARRKTISVISSTKHFAPIMQYLYLNGCSRQRDIALRLEIDKSNLSRVLKALVNCGLLNKMTGPKHVFYELSPDGYAYCKHHDISHLYSISATSKYARLQSDAAQMRAELTHTKDNDFFPRSSSAHLSKTHMWLDEESFADIERSVNDYWNFHILCDRTNYDATEQSLATYSTQKSKYSGTKSETIY